MYAKISAGDKTGGSPILVVDGDLGFVEGMRTGLVIVKPQFDPR